MKYSIAIQERLNTTLLDHLIRDDGQEDLCFALYELGTGKQRISGLLTEIILPETNDRNVHGNVSFNSSYFDRVTKIALEQNKGIVFIHSHPSKGWQHMSPDDIDTENMLAPRVKAVTGRPLIGMTVGNNGAWSARFWIKIKPKTYKKNWCETVRVVGKSLSLTYNDSLLPKPYFGEEFERTISAWGSKRQNDISRLKIGIVGIGSVGSQVAEALLRTGIHDLYLIDFDLIERKNLDRLPGINEEQIGKLKSDVFAEFLNRNKLIPNQKVHSIPYSIIEEEGLKIALDCDILFSCVDRPWPRFILNCISYSHLIPVIDGGIDASYNPKSQNIDQARWRSLCIGPERRCLKCNEQYTPEDVSLEQSGLLEDQTYVKGLEKNHFSKKGENVYAFSLSLAGLEMQQFLSLVLTPKGVYYGVKEMDFITGNIDSNFDFNCEEGCELISLIATGDEIQDSLIDRHLIAEKSRERAIAHDTKYKLSDKIKSFIRRIYLDFISKHRIE